MHRIDGQPVPMAAGLPPEGRPRLLGLSVRPDTFLHLLEDGARSIDVDGAVDGLLQEGNDAPEAVIIGLPLRSLGCPFVGLLTRVYRPCQLPIQSIVALSQLGDDVGRFGEVHYVGLAPRRGRPPTPLRPLPVAQGPHLGRIAGVRMLERVRGDAYTPRELFDGDAFLERRVSEQLELLGDTLWGRLAVDDAAVRHRPRRPRSLAHGIPAG